MECRFGILKKQLEFNDHVSVDSMDMGYNRIQLSNDILWHFDCLIHLLETVMRWNHGNQITGFVIKMHVNFMPRMLNETNRMSWFTFHKAETIWDVNHCCWSHCIKQVIKMMNKYLNYLNTFVFGTGNMFVECKIDGRSNKKKIRSNFLFVTFFECAPFHVCVTSGFNH